MYILNLTVANYLSSLGSRRSILTPQAAKAADELAKQFVTSNRTNTGNKW